MSGALLRQRPRVPGGTGLCSHYRGVCTESAGRPEDRGAVFHAAEITLTEAGEVSGRVIQAFDRQEAKPHRFGARVPA